MRPFVFLISVQLIIISLGLTILVFDSDLPIFESEALREDFTESEQHAIRRDAPFIFNEIHSLLKQWDNTLSPNGFSYTIGSIPKHTKLFHGRKDANTPPSPEWLAFDPEMSFGIMGAWGPSWLRVYRATRKLGPLIYLNGMSAAMIPQGPLHTQDLLIYGRTNDSFWNVWDEYSRAKHLCEWVKREGLDVEGFVRQNAGFELIWCDWSTGLELVANLDTMHWTEEIDEVDGIAPEGRPWLQQDAEEVLPDDLLQFKDSRSLSQQPLGLLKEEPPARPTAPPGTIIRPPGPPGEGGDHKGYLRSPFANYAAWEWYRSAVAVYSGEVRVKLDFSNFVTAYGRPSLPTLPTNGSNAPTHSLSNLTTSDVEQLTSELRYVLRPGQESSGIEWQDVTNQIVNRYERRLPELLGYLSMANNTEGRRKALKVVATLLIPHYDATATVSHNIQSCTEAFTIGFNSDPTLNKHERKQLLAIEHVHRDICTVLIDLYAMLKPEVTTSSSAPHAVADLMSRLRWRAWTKCTEVCAYDSVCSINIWPLGPEWRWGVPASENKPTCRNSDAWTKRPRYTAAGADLLQIECLHTHWTDGTSHPDGNTLYEFPFVTHSTY